LQAEASFLAGEMGVEAFVRAHKAARARFHIRELKRSHAPLMRFV
jgi:hypothetical protein